MSSPRPPLGLLLKQVQQALRSDVEQALAGSGLTLPQVAVLSALRLRPGQSSAELARTSFMRPDMAVQGTRWMSNANDWLGTFQRCTAFTA